MKNVKIKDTSFWLPTKDMQQVPKSHKLVHLVHMCFKYQIHFVLSFNISMWTKQLPYQVLYKPALSHRWKLSRFHSIYHSHITEINKSIYEGKVGIFWQTAKFGQPPCLFHSSIIEIKNKLTKQTVKILMRRLIWIPLFVNMCRINLVSKFTRLYPI